MMSDKFSQFFEEPKNSIEDLKKQFIDNMDMLKAMTVEEQTLYKKWKEITTKYFNKVEPSRIVKAKIWTPTDITDKEKTIEEINNLKPTIRHVTSDMDERDWLMLRVFSHTMSFDQNPGRFLKFLIYDENTGKYLGATSLGSDVISISVRDQWIGWDRDQKLTTGKLNCSAIGTCIMATQPFGYNFLGGKLVASLLTSKVVQKAWKEKYGDTLVGLTTTSLYGTNSMYNSIPFWKKLGSSKGMITIKPDDDVYEFWHHHVKNEMADQYEERILSKGGDTGPITGIKQRTLDMIFKLVGISPSSYRHGFERGVYYAPLYENTREFFRGEVEENELVPLKKLEDDIDSVVNWWKPKAIKRYSKLLDSGRINNDILYYNNMIGLSWDEAKKVYLRDVGR